MGILERPVFPVPLDCLLQPSAQAYLGLKAKCLGSLYIQVTLGLAIGLRRIPRERPFIAHMGRDEGGEFSN